MKINHGIFLFLGMSLVTGLLLTLSACGGGDDVDLSDTTLTFQ